MPTLLTYDFMTEPFPLQASPDTGDLLKTKLTIVATNQGSGDAALEGIQITLPEGPAGTDLTPDASTVLDVAKPPHWTRQTDNMPANVFLFQPDAGYGTVGAGETLTIVITGLQINRKDGTADVPVVEGSGGCQPPDCPTAHLSITKFPNGWGEVQFWVDPLPPVSVRKAVTMHWEGPAVATYTIRYRVKGKSVTVPGPLGSHGSWPGQNDPTLMLDEDTTFYLRVVSGEHSAEKNFPVAVEPPPPKIALFQADWSTDGDRLIFTWDTEYAETCSLTGQHGLVESSSLDRSFFITPSADDPLRSSYTLRAENKNGEAASSTVIMQLQRAEPITNPDSFGGGLFAASPRGDTVAAAYRDLRSAWVTVYVFDPNRDDFRDPRRIGDHFDNFNAAGVKALAAAIAPRGSQLYLMGTADDPPGAPAHFLSVCDVKDSSWPMRSLLARHLVPSEAFVAIAASKANVLVIVRLLDSHRLWSELRVLDPDTLNVRKVIPLEHTARTVCVSADGSRAFVTTGSVNSREDYLNSAVYVIDVNAGAVTKAVTLGNRGPWGAAALSLETGALVAAATDSVSVIDTSSLAVIGTVSVPHECTALAMSPDGTEVIVAARHTGFPGSSNTATVIDIRTCAIAGSVTVDFEPTVVDNMSGYIPVGSAIFTPDNIRALISQSDTNIFTLRRMPTGGTARS